MQEFGGRDVELVRSLAVKRFGDVALLAQALDLEHYWYTFIAGTGCVQVEEADADVWQLCLVAARHRYALALQPPEQLAKTAQTLGLPAPTTA
jgi:hypothetical protein